MNGPVSGSNLGRGEPEYPRDTTVPSVPAGSGARAGAEDRIAQGKAGKPGKSGSSESSESSESKEMPWYVEIPMVIVLTLVFIFLIQTFIGRLYVIPSGSMEPTLHGENGSGDRIFVEKLTYAFDDPEPGDVIVFKGTDSWNTGFETNRSDNPVIRGVQEVGSWVGLVPKDENTLVKRIIAEGGQTVSCQEGDPAVMVDGQPIQQDYIMKPSYYPVDPSTGSDACGGQYFGPLEVPEDHYFMMGDNRTNSSDSRYHMGDGEEGTIPRENIRGKVLGIVFPLNRFGGVESPDIQQ